MKPAVALLLFSASFAHAASITSSASCTIHNGEFGAVLATQVSDSDCSLSVFGSGASAHTEYSNTHNGMTQNLSILSQVLSSSGTYIPAGEDFSLASSSVSAASLFGEFSIGTVGEVRNGIMRYTITSALSRTDNSTATLGLTSAYLQAGCAYPFGEIPNCYANSGTVLSGSQISGEVVIPLGTHFDLSFIADAGGSGAFYAGASSYAAMNLALSFFEVDGSTQVQLAPEPGTWLMLGSAVVLLIGGRRYAGGKSNG